MTKTLLQALLLGALFALAGCSSNAAPGDKTNADIAAFRGDPNKMPADVRKSLPQGSSAKPGAKP